jgi:Raf kinase inhibitor-like YbhB/YbcL family protein
LFKKWFLAVLVMSFWTSGALAAQKIDVGSRDIPNGKTIADKFVFSGFGCSGKNVSPEVHWSHLPAGTKSLALTVYDPDAPTGSGWWHWVVYNLPPTLKGLPEGAGNKNGKRLPRNARQAVNDFGYAGYGGPCPPPGDAPHHYIFTVYALKTSRLKLPPHPSPALIGYFIHMNMIGEGRFVGRYGRSGQ